MWGCFVRIFLGPLLNSSLNPRRAMFHFAQKERRQSVQLHVGLREFSLEEFSCTQSLP